MYTALYFNGSIYREQRKNFKSNPGREGSLFIAALITFNGSSDYVELYGAVDDSGSGQGYFVGAESRTTFFGGYLLSTT